MNNKDAITETLAQAVATSEPAQDPRDPFQPPAWRETEEGKAFLTDVREADSLQLFDGTLQVVGPSASAFGRDDLANWMVERAMTVGAKQTVEELDRYIGEDRFDAHLVMVLSGLPVDAEHVLANGTRLVPAHNVPNERLAAALAGGSRTLLPNASNSSALVCDLQLTKEHRSQTDGSEERKRFDGSALDEMRRTLEDARLCLTLVRRDGCGVQAIATPLVAGDDVPNHDWFVWRLHSYRTPSPLAPPLIPVEAQVARSLLDSFGALDPASQDHLRIPMQKLNECAAGFDWTQGAIDLRVALESLFLNDNTSGELSYRLALRAAMFTGGDLNAREDTRKKIKTAYGLCSNAVHNGRLDLKAKDVETLEWARELVRNTLRRMIGDGNAKPDWASIELGGETANCSDP